MADAETLTPPKRVGTEDPGAKDLADTSESEDHFSDAQSAPQSPVPKTRVEKVDGEPSHGEVPGTDAYRQREGDAVPDEVAIIEKDDKNETSAAAGSDSSLATPPGGQPIPKTVVEESSGSVGGHSEEFLEKRKADAEADEVVRADEAEARAQEGGNTDPPVLSGASSPAEETQETPTIPEVKVVSADGDDTAEDAAQDNTEDAADDVPEEEDDDQDFGDDFDDFEEGGEDAEFDDFEDGFQQPEAETPPPVAAPAMPTTTLPFPIPDFDGLDGQDIFDTIDPYLNSLFPPEELELPTLPPLPKESSIFFTPRSASLWSQLVAPPPLAPPDWIRSRIRRLFLVSLGVPVDLDEILPASKQKKLVLPSLHRKNSNGSRRTSTDSRSVSRLRQSELNASSTSLDSKGNAKPPAAGRKRGPPPAPELDLVAVRQLATTTDEALDGMTDQEIQAHVKRLKDMEDTAKVVLEHWKKKTDEKIGDREAFEGVIENLVKHARNSRK